MLVHQVHGVTGKVRAAGALALDQKGILAACLRSLELAGPGILCECAVGAGVGHTGHLPDEIVRNSGHRDGLFLKLGDDIG